MKKAFFFCSLITALSVNAQVNEVLTFDSISLKLIDYLHLKGEIDSNRVQKLKSKEYKFGFVGFINKTDKGDLKDGIYVFSSLSSHSQIFYVIVENNTFTILDFSKRAELDDAIKKILDFSERKKYCVDITTELVSAVVGSYYNINKYPLNRRDINCYKGIVSNDDLP